MEKNDVKQKGLPKIFTNFLIPIAATKQYHDFYKSFKSYWEDIEIQKKAAKSNSKFGILRLLYGLLIMIFLITFFMPYLLYTRFWGRETIVTGLIFHTPIGWVGITGSNERPV